MRTSSRFISIASCAAVAALAAGCSTRTVTLSAPVPVATTVAPTVVTQPVAVVEFGRVTNIEFMQSGTTSSSINVPGAVVGGVAGAVAGSALSGGRDAATVLGGVAGAAIGSQVGRPTTTTVSSAYRVTIQTDSGGYRTYDVPATGDLRVGDRVRVENGVIYRA